MNGTVMDHADACLFQLGFNLIPHHYHAQRRICRAVIEFRIPILPHIGLKALCGMGMHDQHLRRAIPHNGKSWRFPAFLQQCGIVHTGTVPNLSALVQIHNIYAGIALIRHPDDPCATRMPHSGIGLFPRIPTGVKHRLRLRLSGDFRGLFRFRGVRLLCKPAIAAGQTGRILPVICRFLLQIRPQIIQPIGCNRDLGNELEHTCCQQGHSCQNASPHQHTQSVSFSAHSSTCFPGVAACCGAAYIV